jgi:sugar/nucleoside kinase (ribokinase family)
VSILVVGSVAFDAIKTPFGEVGAAQGGSAVYFSLAASCFTEVKLVAVVGEDFGIEHRSVFKDRPIDLAGLVRVSGKTFRWSGEYRFDMNEATTLKTELNVLEGFSPEVPAEYRETPFLFLANIDPDLQRRVLSQVKRPRFVAADTMNFWIDSKRESLERLLPELDALVINEGEARMLGRDVNLRKAARNILKDGPRTLILKRGEHGVLMFNGDRVFAAPGMPLETVVDPTGAGDSFAGGMMGRIAATGDLSDAGLRQALVYGSTMASFTVEDFGVKRLASVSKTEIAERYRSFEELTSFAAVAARLAADESDSHRTH